PAAYPCDLAFVDAAFSLTLTFVVAISHEYISIRPHYCRRNSNPNQLALYSSSHSGFSRSSHHVHFTANAKFRQIDSGLNGKTGVRKNQSLIVSFKIIEICAAAMDFCTDVMAGAMREVFAKTCGTDHVA